MKIALVTTTIFVPKVLALYAKLGPDVMMFIAGDRKTPDMPVVDFLTDACPNHAYYGIDTQHKMYPALSAAIGENCIQRRNIATLEALKWGADIIVSVDDDNIPLDDYFAKITNIFTQFGGLTDEQYAEFYLQGYCKSAQTHGLFSGLAASSASGWFDVGQLLSPKAEHRGFPHTRRAEPVYKSVTNARIGVAAGICMGDPDIGAVERIANGPTVHGVSEILRAGVVTDPRTTLTVYNSQNTAFIREIAPAMFMFPHWGRYDDIMASLVTQQVMADLGLHVHFGRPFVWQQRNKHNLTQDLTMEIMGMQNIEKMAQFLDDMPPGATSHPMETLGRIFRGLRTSNIMPSSGAEAALLWLDECEKVL